MTRATLANLYDPKRNSFDFLRFALAVLVIFSHSYYLGGWEMDPLDAASGRQASFGILAVRGFFILSGFLITASFLKSSSLGVFLWHRFLRIYPGYWVCLVVTAFGFATLLHGSFSDVWNLDADGPVTYVLRNASLLAIFQPEVGRVLDPFPFPGHINGSIWTLPHELGCYAAAALLGTLGLFGRPRRRILVTSLGVLGLFIGLSFVFPPTSTIQYFLGFLCCFLIGSLIYLYREHLVLHGGIALALAVVASVAACTLGFAAYFLMVPAIAYGLFWLAVKLPLTRFGRFGDFSYGIYIYGWPVQQLLTHYGVPQLGFTVYFLASLVLSLGLAVPSYYLVERPALKLKSRRWALRHPEADLTATASQMTQATEADPQPVSSL